MRKRKGEGVVQSWVSNQWQQIRIGQQNWSWVFFYHSSKSVRILFKNECSSDLGRRAQSLGTGPRNLHFNKPLPDAHTQQGLWTTGLGAASTWQDAMVVFETKRKQNTLCLFFCSACNEICWLIGSFNFFINPLSLCMYHCQFKENTIRI